MTAVLLSNGWTTRATINEIGGCRPAIMGRDLMPALGMKLIQAPAEERVLNIQGQLDTDAQGDDLDDWEKHFSKKFNNLFHRVGRICKYKVHAEFLKNLTPIQQKGTRVSITLQGKVDEEIATLLT